MRTDDLRNVIRDLLAEELAVLRAEMGQGQSAPQVREEVVTMACDADLDRFARKIAGLAASAQGRADIEAGRHVFRLAGSSGRNRAGASAATFAPRPQALRSAQPCFDKGLISEKHIMALEGSPSVIKVGKQACFTPLALDELRQRGIKIERAKS